MGIATVREAAGLGAALLVVPVGTVLPLHSHACGVACVRGSLSPPALLWQGRKNGFSYPRLDLVGNFLPKAILHGNTVQITAAL